MNTHQYYKIKLQDESIKQDHRCYNWQKYCWPLFNICGYIFYFKSKIDLASLFLEKRPLHILLCVNYIPQQYN